MTHIEEGSNQYACLSVPCQIIDHGHRGSLWYLSRLEIELLTTSRASSTTCSSTSFPVSISPLASSSPSFTWCSYRCYETCYSCCCQPRPALVLVCTALLWGWQLPTGCSSLPPVIIERLKVKFLIMRKMWNFKKKKWHTVLLSHQRSRRKTRKKDGGLTEASQLGAVHCWCSAHLEWKG